MFENLGVARHVLAAHCVAVQHRTFAMCKPGRRNVFNGFTAVGVGGVQLPAWPHVVAACVHGLMTLVCCIAAANRDWFLFGARVPLWRAADGGGDPENRMVRVPDWTGAGSWDVVGAAAVVHAFTTAAHCVYAFNPEAGPRCRWWEYAVSAPLVFIQLAVTTGTRQVEVLLLSAAAVFAAMPYGFQCLVGVDTASGVLGDAVRDARSRQSAPGLVPVASVTRGPTNWWNPREACTAALSGLPAAVTPGAAALVATVAVAAVLVVVLIGFDTIVEEAPGFVAGIVVVQVVLLSSFGVVGVIPVLVGPACFSRAATIEAAFCVLSFASKAVPTLIFLAGVTK